MSKKELMELVKNLQAEMASINTPESPGELREDLYKILAQSSQAGCYVMQNKHFRFCNSHFIEYAGSQAKKRIVRHESCVLYSAGRPAEDG